MSEKLPHRSASAAATIPLPGFKDFVAGGLAGMAQVAVGHPLDTVKVRLQLEGI